MFIHLLRSRVGGWEGEKLNAILLLIVQVAVAMKALALSWWSRPWVPVFARQHVLHASETSGRQVSIQHSALNRKIHLLKGIIAFLGLFSYSKQLVTTTHARTHGL